MSRGFIIIFELGGVFERLAAFVGQVQSVVVRRYQRVAQHVVYGERVDTGA